MTESWPAITGIGSVSPYDPVAGLIPRRTLEPSPITGWPTPGMRRAFVVGPFRPASVVPGLKTRRLDRLSTWALVASALAARDAGLDLRQVDRSRVAVVFATGLGCVELTEAFYRSAAEHGWSGTDPSTFPETLASQSREFVSRPARTEHNGRQQELCERVRTAPSLILATPRAGRHRYCGCG
jgi:3-oxoacyl-(acyl-carrier-protein) synthase